MKQKFESLTLSKFAAAQVLNQQLNAILGGKATPTSWTDSDGSKGGDTNNGDGTTDCGDMTLNGDRKNP